jgi:hypothetical protein
MSQVVSNAGCLQLARKTLDIQIVLHPVLIFSQLLASDGPTWLNLFPAEIQHSLVLLQTEESSLQHWVIKVLLSLVEPISECGAAECACYHREGCAYFHILARHIGNQW